MVVGLTGKYCAGKDTVARIFASKGFTIIDVDLLGHEALAGNAREVVAAFGPGVSVTGGGVDRRALGRVVFKDSAALARLESIVHPAMVERVKSLVAQSEGNVVINAAILHRMGLHALCDAVVCVSSPFPLRLARAMVRDMLSFRDALARARSQKDICPQLNDPAVDIYSVRNRGSARSLERRVTRLVQRMQARGGCAV